MSASAFISTCKVNDSVSNSSTLSDRKFAGQAHKFYTHRTDKKYQRYMLILFTLEDNVIFITID